MWEQDPDDHIIGAFGPTIDKLGPCVIEIVVCHRCKIKSLVLHPFLESVVCGSCGHRNRTFWESRLKKSSE